MPKNMVARPMDRFITTTEHTDPIAVRATRVKKGQK